jgi:WD40 repeat protein
VICAGSCHIVNVFFFLQLFRGRTVVAETVHEKGQVTACKLSSCGRFLVYGCCDGLVKVFEVASKSTSAIIGFGAAVHYLQVCCSNGFTVIAAAEDNSLKVSVMLRLL